MRIAFIASNRTSPQGGSEELWSKTALYALQQGHDVACVVYDWKHPHPAVAKIKSAGGIIILRKLRGLHKSIMDRIYLKLRHILSTRFFGEDYEFNTLKKWKPDSICLSQGGAYDHAYHPTYETLFQNIQCPYFVLAHSYRDNGFLPDWQRERSRNVLLGAKRVLFVAKAQKQVIEKQLLTSLKNTRIVRNPMNLTSMDIVPFPSGETLKLAMVGYLAVRWKGHDILLESLSSKVWRQRDWMLSIYGIGEDQDSIMELITYYQLEDKVSFMGFHEDIRDVWSKQQVLIMPSRIESAPLTVCEAMICGRPILTTDIGDMAEFFEDDKSGFLAAAPNEKHVSEALERLWQRKEELALMGEFAHTTMIKKYANSPEAEFLSLITE